MTPLRTAVIGAGHMGRFHAAKFAAAEGSRLVAVADANQERAAEVAQPLGCEAVSDYTRLFGKIDAACIAVPTVLHREVASACIEAGVHVLVEKPLARTLAEADTLLELARARGVVLQVGHLQRFNPAFMALAAHTGRPLFIDIERLAPFKARGIDVDVVLDLMIHDLDLVLALAKSPVEKISASGFRVLTDGIDIANARVEFADGCVANISASRVSQAPVRKFRVFWPDQYASADLQGQRLRTVRRGAAGVQETDEAFERQDELEAQTRAFLAAVRGGEAGRMPGSQGREALALALTVVEQVRERLARHERTT
jgi:predicted dehydrogenase